MRFVVCAVVGSCVLGACSSDRRGAEVLDSGLDASALANDAAVSDAGHDGGVDSSIPAGPFCTGTPGLKLAIVTSTPRPESSLLTEIGYSYLYVLGDCRYYVLAQGWDQRRPLMPARMGTFDEARAQALARSLNYFSWRNLDSAYGAGGDDSDTTFFYDGSNVVPCTGCGPGGNVPPELVEASAAYRQLMKPLWDESSEVDGPMRVHVQAVRNLPTDPSEGEGMLRWPFAWPPEDILPSGDEVFVTIRDEAKVQDLRQVRKKYRDDDLEPGEFNQLLRGGYFTFYDADEWTVYSLWMRDLLPLENDEGRIELVER